MRVTVRFKSQLNMLAVPKNNSSRTSLIVESDMNNKNAVPSFAQRFITILGFALGLLPMLVAFPVFGQVLEANTDRMGMDYQRLLIPTCSQKCATLPAGPRQAACDFECRQVTTDLGPTYCMQECFADLSCKAFTYVKPGIHAPEGVCYLKNGFAPASPSTCCVSGVHGRPITMLSFGDSVMWGTGLMPDDKFSHRVAAWIRSSNLGAYPVNHFAFAVTGAVVGDPTANGSGPNEQLDGEVARANPTIPRQIEMSSATLTSHGILDGEVDLVLINGGANDVDFVTTITDITIGNHGVVDRIATILDNGKNLEKLYRQALQKFESATVIVTNYYSPVEPTSHPEHIILLGLVSPLGGGGVAYANAVFGQSKTFGDTMNRTIANAVRQVRSEAAFRNRKLLIAGNGIGSDCGLFTNPSCVWGPVPNINTTAPYATDDPQRENRRLACEAFSSQNPTCKVASMFHPNVTGAGTYFLGIIAAITNAKPSLAGLRKFELQVNGSSRTVGGNTIKTVTVNAVDVETGQPVNAKVSIKVVRGRRVTETTVGGHHGIPPRTKWIKTGGTLSTVTGYTGEPIRYNSCTDIYVDSGQTQDFECSGEVIIGSGYTGQSDFKY